MYFSRALFLALVCAIAAIAQDAQQPLSLDNASPILTPHLDAAILDILKKFKTPGGVGVAVVRKTAQGTWQVETKGYGNATADGAQVTADTLFAIGSNSKLFDILATGLLISNETLTPRISWTSKIASIIPGWKLMDPVATRESTLIDIMSHRTGLPRHDFMTPLDVSAADIIPRLQHVRPSTGFREQTQYNNHMYTVLSYLPTVLLNTSYEQYVRDNILTPLGMEATTYFYADAVKTGKLADGFLREGANLTQDPFATGTVRALPFWDRSPKGHVISGAGGVISSALDMAIWLQMLLTGGKSPSNETVIPAAVINKVATGVSVFTPVAAYPELSPVVYGGGQLRGTYRGVEMIEHGGSTIGFKSQVTRFPSKDLAIAVLTNEEDWGNMIMEAVKYRIVDEALQLEPVDWTARYRTKISQSVPPPFITRPKNAEAPAVPYAALAGAYDHRAYGKLDFCLFWEDRTAGSACAGLAPDVEKLLPGVIDPAVPTLISRWDTMVSNYMRLAHYSGNVFNLTALYGYDPSEGWVLKVEGLQAEFEVKGEDIGFATIGVWGEGAGVEAPTGDTVEERAEVWFQK
ncbi:beta-lactamase/transpeptidase-like protein [Mycena alexandri]|uniref:Beta-lactamase/transpeptidase-like protein n=1 Tax=Mycena alexandri TaxID=1745969 RepID=A0AAD6SQY6_9AGAR|nr:beta-lactamase/transpeptidase-like protein [Mycena alexandri]